MNRRQRIVTMLLLIILPAACGAKSPGKEKLKWYSFDEGLARAAKEKKFVMIDFYTDWCKWCKVMDKKTFRDPRVAKTLREHFVAVRVNAEDRNARAAYQGRSYGYPELTRLFRVTGFPAIVFLEPDGKLIGVLPGFREADFFDPFLDYVRRGCYKENISFEEFLKKRGESD